MCVGYGHYLWAHVSPTTVHSRYIQLHLRQRPELELLVNRTFGRMSKRGLVTGLLFASFQETKGGQFAVQPNAIGAKSDIDADF